MQLIVRVQGILSRVLLPISYHWRRFYLFLRLHGEQFGWFWHPEKMRRLKKHEWWLFMLLYDLQFQVWHIQLYRQSLNFNFKLFMNKYLLSLLAFFFSFSVCSAIEENDIRWWLKPDGLILDPDYSVIDVFSLVQEFLLKAVLPLVVAGTTLYIAYHLLTAEGDEARMKQAWKSLGYGTMALVMIALSYALVSLLSNISL